jgi:hypothetical protein
LKIFSEQLLIVLPRLSPHTNRNLRLPKAYVNLVEFFQKRYEIEAHVISSAESYRIVPKLETVKSVLAVHPADIEYFKRNVVPLDENGQDILYQDAYNVAAEKIPLIRGLSVEDRFVAASGREKAAVNHIAQKYYDIIVDFESPWNSAYKLKPKMAAIYLRVSTLNLKVNGFLSGEPLPLHDLSTLLMYDGVHKPLGCWQACIS